MKSTATTRKKKTMPAKRSSAKLVNLPLGLSRFSPKTIRAILFVMAFATVGIWVLLFALAASHDATAESKLYNLQNQRRAEIGKSGFFRSSCLTNVARERAANMADGAPYDHPSSAARRELTQRHCGRAMTYTENINWASAGWGSGDALGKAHFDAYMGSPGHKEKIEGNFNYVGVGLMVNPSTGESYSAVVMINCSDCGPPISTPLSDSTPDTTSSRALPEGYLDSVNCDPNVIVAGWARDQDNLNTALAIHIYVDGPAGTTGIAPPSGYTANLDSPDVGRHRYVMPFSALNAEQQAALKRAGNHPIYVYGIGVDRAGNVDHKNAVLTLSPKYYNPSSCAPPVDGRAPDTPGSFRVYGKNSTAIGLAWTAPYDDVGVTGYNLSISGGGKNESVTIRPKTSQIWGGLTPNTYYTFKLRAFDASGKQSGEATTSYTTDPSPSSTTGTTRTIVGVDSSRCLTVHENRDANGTVINIYDCYSGASNQQWTLKQWSDGSYEVRSNVGSKTRCLDLPNGWANDGQNLSLFDCNSSPAQKWFFESSKICSAIVNPNRTKCLDVEGPSTANLAPVQVWEYYGQRNQQWR